MLKYFTIIISFVFCSCGWKNSGLKELFSLPKDLDEASAVQMVTGSELIWTLQDAGNEPLIYGIDRSGNIEQTIRITNATNTDWEDLTTDNEGNLYIGDFGNNDGRRKNAVIYKLNASSLNKDDAQASQKIDFYFPEQKKSENNKLDKFYDVESFFLYHGNFYLFTKTKGKKVTGETLMFEVPNTVGNHLAKFVGRFKTCDKSSRCAITSADISRDGKTVVLLSSTYIWLLTDYKDTDFFGGKSQRITLKSTTQKEGICFKSKNTLLISDELKNKNGGKIYEADLNDLKSKS